MLLTHHPLLRQRPRDSLDPRLSIDSAASR
jgi:hypothetical protein